MLIVFFHAGVLHEPELPEIENSATFSHFQPPFGDLKNHPESGVER